MSSTTIHFPSAEVMTNFLSSHTLFDLPYLKEKKITQTIVKLAAERFANSDVVDMGVKMGVLLIVHDLQSGEDGFTGKKLPTFGGLPAIFWAQMSMSLESALMDCAKLAPAEAKEADSAV